MSSGRSALFVLVLLLALPGFTYAKDIQANQQCPPGGTVGQKCTDTTNGYVTQGTCTHIYVCKAVSWNTAQPKGCGSSGNINAPTTDCPKGPAINTGTTIRSATTTTPVTVDANSPFRSDIFDQAFSDIDITSDYPASDFVSTTSLNGIEYFISGGEALQAGAPLTEAPPEIVAPQRVTLALGSVYGLVPTSAETDATQSAETAQSYTPALGTFTSSGSGDYAPATDFYGQAVRLSGQIADTISKTIGSLFTQNTGKQMAALPTPPLSLYAQVHWKPSTFMELGAQDTAEGFIDTIFRYIKSIGEAIAARVFPAFPR
jgi:hypothetical protein